MSPADEARQLYGADPSSWVYCYRCDMAVSLEERAAGGARFRPGRGLQHGICPNRGDDMRRRRPFAFACGKQGAIWNLLGSKILCCDELIRPLSRVHQLLLAVVLEGADPA